MVGIGDRHGLYIYVGCLRTLIGNKETILYLLLGAAFLPHGSDSRGRKRLDRDSLEGLVAPSWALTVAPEPKHSKSFTLSLSTSEAYGK